MKIKYWMTPDPITVGPDDLLIDASRLMKENRMRRLPVVEKGKLVGLITYRNVIEASPSQASSLSVHELNYLVANLKVKDSMRKKPETVGPEDSVIDTVIKGHKMGIGAFPVVDKGRLVGIVTETEIFKTFLGLFGDPAENSIIVLENVRLRTRVGQVSHITSIIAARNVPVMAIFSLPHRQREGHRLYIRVMTKDTAPIIADLTAQGYKAGEG